LKIVLAHGHARAYVLFMNNAVRIAAANIVRNAEFMGGREHVKRIADLGYKGELDLRAFDGASDFEARNAIQDAAKDIAASY